MRRRKLDHPKGEGTRNPDQPRQERMKIQSGQGREACFPTQDQSEEERMNNPINQRTRRTSDQLKEVKA